VIVTGALCWWNELPEDLDRCVRGLASIADRVVALDGAYARYPTATPRSSEAECDAIRKAASDMGMDCMILQPDHLWAGQVQKRSALLSLASIGTDWIATVDADHIITTGTEARRYLERATGVDVISVPFWTPPNPDRTPSERSAGLWHEQQAGYTFDIPQLYRALPGLRVEKRHWWYSAYKNGQKVWLWGGDGGPALPIVRMPADYLVEHRCLYRTPEQIRVSRGFLNDREKVVDLTGQEDDQPGLFAPQWDYERMPA